MPFGGTNAKTLAKPIEELRGQRDFRHQDQSLPITPDIFGHGLEIDFGFARACDAIEQRDSVPALFNRGPQRVGSCELGE